MSKASERKDREAEESYLAQLAEFILNEERVAAARFKGWHARMERLLQRNGGDDAESA